MKAMEGRLMRLERAISALDGMWAAVVRAPHPANDNDIPTWARSLAESVGYKGDLVMIVEPGDGPELLLRNQPIGRMSDERWEIMQRNLIGSPSLFVSIHGPDVGAFPLTLGIEAICREFREKFGLEASQ